MVEHFYLQFGDPSTSGFWDIVRIKKHVRYDTVDLRALKIWRDGQLNLAHGTEIKKK